jgi:hypothetical protein
MPIDQPEIMEITDNGDLMNVPDNSGQNNHIEREMKVSDLSNVKIRKYRYHDKFEKK